MSAFLYPSTNLASHVLAAPAIPAAYLEGSGELKWHELPQLANTKKKNKQEKGCFCTQTYWREENRNNYRLFLSQAKAAVHCQAGRSAQLKSPTFVPDSLTFVPKVTREPADNPGEVVPRGTLNELLHADYVCRSDRPLETRLLN